MVRLVLNTTVGVAGFFDVASRLGVQKSDADTGQTLGSYGVGPGPHVDVPLMQPLDVRDGIGYGIDSLLDPLLILLLSLLPWDRLSSTDSMNARPIWSGTKTPRMPASIFTQPCAMGICNRDKPA